MIRQLVQVPLAGVEACLYLQHGGEGHQGPEADHQHQGGGAAEGGGGQRQGQHAGTYGGAGNQQGTTQSFGIHVIHPNVAVSVQTGDVSSDVNKRGQLALSEGASGDRAGG